MPELVIPVGQHIGPGYIDWDEWEYVPGFTVDDIRMRLQWAEYEGQEVDSILLQFGICFGGSVMHAIEIFNYVRGLGIPVKSHVLSITASAGTIVALAASEVVLEHTAQWMVHRPLYIDGTWSQRSEEIRADADRLDRDEQNLVDIYIACTGQTEQAVRDLIKVDRFMSATEAQAFGFATEVKPLTAKAPSTAQAQARLRTYKHAVARVKKHMLSAATSRKKPQPKAKANPSASSVTPKPMTKKVIPISRAVAKPAAAPTAQQKANAQIVANLAKSLGVVATIEGVEADGEEEDTSAAVEATKLKDQEASLYTDGPLAVDSAVFYDEALTEVPDDADYEAEDGRVITVAGGIVTAIETPSGAGSEDAPLSTAAITAAVQAAMGPVNQRLEELSADVARFKKVVPATPVPRARASSASQVDPKGGSASPKPHPMDKAKQLSAARRLLSTPQFINDGLFR
jgi:ATP-dependent Clp protease protease subunit